MHLSKKSLKLVARGRYWSTPYLHDKPMIGLNSFSSQASSLVLRSPNLLLHTKNLYPKRQALLGNTTIIDSQMSSVTSVSMAQETVTENNTSKLTKETADSFVMKLSNEERATLMDTLQHYESEETKTELKGQLAAFRWRTKLGRPSNLPGLGDVDPTGSYCPVPEDWLLKKYTDTIPKPTRDQLFGVAVHNAVPFIGFGFLDNFLMIICGDYIELTLGSVMTISTMAAAALGNTMGDVLGLGCAGYVESLAAKIGVKPPSLSPIQLNMKSSRVFANLGRGIGVTIGCLLGMLPLLFMNKESEGKEKIKEPKEV